MKRLLSIVPLILLLTLTGFAQGVCNRHSEPAGGFSVCVPDGWSVMEREKEKYKVIFKTGVKVFTPNLNFKDEAYRGTLADYVAAAVKVILDKENYQKIGATSVALVSRENFMTADRTPGVKVTFSTEYKGLIIRTLQFYFESKPGLKLIVTCTALDAEKATNDPSFEYVLKSFQINK